MIKHLICAWLLIPTLCVAQLPAVGKTELGVQDVMGSINLECIQYKILGPCPVTPLQATHVLVSYYDPVVMIETSPRTGESILASGAFDVLGGASGTGSKVLGLISSSVLGGSGTWSAGGGAGTAHASGNSNLHFREARVYTIPSIVGSTCGLCSQASNQFTVHYLSDADVLWRFSQPRLSLEPPLPGTGPMGVWGKLNPRVGFLSHGSHHVAGAASAIRAAWIAFDPAGSTALPPDPRLVIQPSTVQPRCWQVGYPKRFEGLPNACYPPGAHPAYWDRGLQSPDSAMLHFLYALKTC